METDKQEKKCFLWVAEDFLELTHSTRALFVETAGVRNLTDSVRLQNAAGVITAIILLLAIVWLLGLIWLSKMEELVPNERSPAEVVLAGFSFGALMTGNNVTKTWVEVQVEKAATPA